MFVASLAVSSHRRWLLQLSSYVVKVLLWGIPRRLTVRVFWFRSVQTGGSGGSLTPLVNFYSKLPKGPAPQSNFGGLKAKYFNGKNASAAPILATILGIFTIGYTIDYQSAYTTFALVLEPTLTVHFIFSHDLYLRTGLTRCAVHLSASELQKFSPYGMTATDVWLLSTFPRFRAPQEPRPLIHDARSGAKRHGHRLDKRYYTCAFICYRESNARRSCGQYNLRVPCRCESESCPQMESFVLPN